MCTEAPDLFAALLSVSGAVMICAGSSNKLAGREQETGVLSGACLPSAPASMHEMRPDCNGGSLSGVCVTWGRCDHGAALLHNSALQHGAPVAKINDWYAVRAGMAAAAAAAAWNVVESMSRVKTSAPTCEAGAGRVCASDSLHLQRDRAQQHPVRPGLGCGQVPARDRGCQHRPRPRSAAGCAQAAGCCSPVFFLFLSEFISNCFLLGLILLPKSSHAQRPFLQTSGICCQLMAGGYGSHGSEPAVHDLSALARCVTACKPLQSNC